MKWALITGASSGIGKELAFVAAQHKYHVILIARRLSLLEESAEHIRREGMSAVSIEADLTDASATTRVMHKVKNITSSLQLLVNNAGFGLGGEFHKQDISLHADMLHLNVHAVVHLTHALLPLISDGGMILNVSSAGAFQALPYMTVYGATKAFVLSFSQALHEELKARRISVTAFCPGPVHTEFGSVVSRHSTHRFQPHRPADAKKTAKYAYRACVARRAIAIYPFSFRILAFLTRLLPYALTASISRRVMQHWTKNQ